MNKLHVKIHKVAAAELAAVQEIDQGVNQTPWTLNAYQESWHNPQHTILGIYNETQLCGACTYATSADEAEILQLCIAKPWQQQGLATQLLKRVIAILLDSGVTLLFLEVMDGNLQAIALYSKLCFNQVGIRKNYYSYQGRRIDAQILALQLIEDRRSTIEL